MILLIFFILGLIIGSFLNVVVYRLRTAEELFLDRSKCPHCKSTIVWYDNIPVISFILLKFRCRKCRKKISWQYPLVEIGTGLIFALVGHYFFSAQDPTTWFPAFYYLLVSSFLIAVLVYDWLWMEIPDALLWPVVWITAAAGLILDWTNFGGGAALSWGATGLLAIKIYSGMLAAMFGFTFFFLMVVFSRERWMGMGDVYLAIPLGLFLGFPGTLLALFLSFAVGAAYGIILIAFGRKRLKSQVPFAPFLVIGTFISFFFYSGIVGWYMSLF